MRIKLKIFFIFCIFSTLSIKAQISRVSYFNAIILGNDIRLDFTISKGGACNGYQILKSIDSVNYSVIYDYSGICGNSTTDESYSYTDAGVTPNSYVYYKVLIPPFDYSSTIRMFIDQKKIKKNILYTYPQPVTNVLTIYLNDENYKDYTMRIIDNKGIIRRETSLTAYKYITTDMADLEEGLYCVILVDKYGDFERGKVIKR